MKIANNNGHDDLCNNTIFKNKEDKQEPVITISKPSFDKK